MEEKNILKSIIDYMKPKAHDAIDGLTEMWEESKKRTEQLRLPPELEESIRGMAMGSIGGAGKKSIDLFKTMAKGSTRNIIDPFLKKEIKEMAKKGFKYKGPGKDYSSYHKTEWHKNNPYMKTKKPSSSNLKKLLPFLFLQSGVDD